MGAVRRRLIGAAILAAAALAVYARSFGVPFLFDDLLAIPENPAIRSLSGSFSTSSETALAGRPLTSFTFALNHAAGGLAVGGYHAVNLAIHLLCAGLVWGVTRRLLSSPRVRADDAVAADGLALAAALLWTVHPLATETVVYVVQRTESLMALCLFATLYAFLRAVSSTRPGPWLLASVAACALGMGCKQVMVVAPLVVWSADALFVTGSFGASLRKRAPYYAGLAATWAVLGVLLAGGEVARATGLDRELGVTPLQYLWTLSRAILHYLRLAAWPTPLVLHYDWTAARSLRDAWPTVALVGALFAATAVGVWRRIPAAFAGAVFFLVLAPTSSLVPIPTELVAERRMYVPLAALLALAIVGARRALVRLAEAPSRPGSHPPPSSCWRRRSARPRPPACATIAPRSRSRRDTVEKSPGASSCATTTGAPSRTSAARTRRSPSTGRACALRPTIRGPGRSSGTRWPSRAGSRSRWTRTVRPFCTSPPTRRRTTTSRASCCARATCPAGSRICRKRSGWIRLMHSGG